MVVVLNDPYQKFIRGLIFINEFKIWDENEYEICCVLCEVYTQKVLD